MSDLRRNVVIFGNGGSFYFEKTCVASNRWPEFHWRELLPIRPLAIPSKGEMVCDTLPINSRRLMRYRFACDEHRQATVTMIPGHYTMAKKEVVVWTGHCMFLDDVTVNCILREALE